MIAKIQAWLNLHPVVKSAVATFEGAAFGVLASYLTGIVNDNGAFSGAGLKRTCAMAVSTGLVAVYNMFKTVPGSANK